MGSPHHPSFRTVGYAIQLWTSCEWVTYVGFGAYIHFKSRDSAARYAQSKFGPSWVVEWVLGFIPVPVRKWRIVDVRANW
jgi:hypothetical protein